MIRLNGANHDYRPGLSLKELVDVHNESGPKLGFKGFVVVVDGVALTLAQAEEKVLEGGETIFIVPVLDGG